MITIEQIIQKYQARYPLEKIELIEQADQLIQKKLLEERFIKKSLQAASIIVEMLLDLPCLLSSLLHYAYVEKLITLEQIKIKFGDEVALITECSTKIILISPTISKEDRIAEQMRQMMFAISKDLRAVFVILAFQLVKIRRFNQIPLEQAQEIAQETLDIYAPITRRLGLSSIKNEIENTSFACLHPDKYQEIVAFCSQHKTNQPLFLQNLHHEIAQLLEEHHIEAEIQKRSKSYYSIFRKSQKIKTGYDHIYDLIAVRIIVQDKDDCYKVLGIIHEQFQPISKKFKDYISTPKSNGYQSLHTTVLSREGIIFEVQIRTHEMHQIAELGVAAHWTYKESSSFIKNNDENIAWLRELTQNLLNISDTKESVETYTHELYADFVYTITPQGKIIKLPVGATVIDFAYAIHSEIGNTCSGAKINGNFVTIRTVLQNGDQVEIITSKKQTPTKDWLNYVASAKTRYRIRAYLSEQIQIEAEKLGLELFQRQAKKLAISVSDIQNSSRFKEFIQKSGYQSIFDYYRALGLGKIDLKPLEKLFVIDQKPKSSFKQKIANVLYPKSYSIRIAGVDNIMVRNAKCCSPLPGDPVIGIVTQGDGISLHLKSCKNITSQKINPDRLVEVEWVENIQKDTLVSIVLRYKTNIQTTLNVMKVFANQQIQLIKNHSEQIKDQTQQELLFKGITTVKLEKLLKKLNQIKGVRAKKNIF